MFPDFELGTQFMFDVSRSGSAPASLRLVDNKQFQFGLAIKPAETDQIKMLVSKLMKMYLMDWKKFSKNKICLGTIVYEGSKHEVKL